MCLNPMLSVAVNGKVLDFKKIAKFKKQYSEKLYKDTTSENIVEIPCGKCKECKKQKLMQLKIRLKNECKYHKDIYFATLTYDEEHKKNLNKRDIQLFLKRYRKKEKIRYFYVGELGEQTKRPHYHIIIFGHIPKDLEKDKQETKSGFIQYTSKELTNIWQNGIVKISKMNEKLIGYILKYILKNDNEKEFLYGYSTKPPLGIREQDIKERITKRNRTRAENQYYKYRYGELPEIESLKIDKIEKIKEIEKQCKMPYYQYIQQKRQEN